ENFQKVLNDIIAKLEKILASYDAGRVLREGISAAIVGKPNVGKSTLMNLLSGTARSIVTDVAGTTRDVIEETVTVGEITLRLADTAGIHSTDDTVEKVGVDLAKARIESSELVLAVFDQSAPLDNEDLKLLENIKNKKAIVILNKNDIGDQIDKNAFGNMPLVLISAKTGDGYEALASAIAKITSVAQLNPDAAVLGSERQRDCAKRALDASRFALDTMKQGISIDAVGVCLDDAVAALLELTGKRVTNEVADEVFRHFCVGK
ncbi:MAG: 50S ribosome-binding GTPase, partial [Clostridia bacterium]|nr:50S ribosome-binding GTPase [Clostridia bacterium]